MSELDIDTRITDDRTVIMVRGTRDIAIVVRSDDGERIFLPPERFDEPVATTPYRSPYQSSAARSDRDDNPYRDAGETTRGVIETADGFQVHYDESISEFDVYRDD